jgi:hypothetical protein
MKLKPKPSAVPPQARTLSSVLGYFVNVKERSSPGEFSACCPSHENEYSRPSFGLRIVDAGLGRQRLLICCYAGCSGTEILEALGLTSWDQLTFPKSGIPSLPTRKPAASIPAAPPDPAVLAEVAALVGRAAAALHPGRWNLGARARAYLENQRGLPRSVYEQAQLGFDREAIVFPYFREGRAETVKFRSLICKDFWCWPHGPRFLYGLDSLRPGGVAFLTEGEFDALSIALGHTAVSLPSGARTATAAVLEPLKSQSRVWVCTDADAGGEAAAERTVAILGAERCRRLKFGRHKDANDALRKLGLVKFRQLLETGRAKWLLPRLG